MKNYLLHEREYYIAKTYRSLGMGNQLKHRWTKIKYREPKNFILNKQLAIIF